MKKILIILDGAADLPCVETSGLTPFEAAETPNLDYLAKTGTVSTFHPSIGGTIPGSENAIPRLLGYPDEVCTGLGRGPLEAIGLGISLCDREFAMRCNIVEFDSNGNLLTDRPTGINHQEIKNQFLGTFSALKKMGYIFYHLDNLKTLAVSKNAKFGHVCISPQEAFSKEIKKWQFFSPEIAGKEEADLFNRTVVNHIEIAGQSDTRFFGLWCWGGGTTPSLVPFSRLSGYSHPVCITGTPLVRGIAIAASMELVNVAGATGDHLTSYEAKAEATTEALRHGADFVLLHVEAPDEAGHLGDAQLKKRIFEDIDKRLLGRLLDRLNELRIDVELTITPDHATPCSLRRHTSAPVSSLTMRLTYQ